MCTHISYVTVINLKIRRTYPYGYICNYMKPYAAISWRKSNVASETCLVTFLVIMMLSNHSDLNIFGIYLGYS